MDSCFHVWNTEVEVGFPLSCQIKPQGLDHNELEELLWQNGEVVLNSQKHRKPSHDSNNPNNPIQDDETASWIHCPIDEAFEKDFCAKLLSQIPPSPDFAPIALPHLRSAPLGLPHENQNLGGGMCNIVDPLKGQGCSHVTQSEIPGCSGMTIGSSHCGSNQVVNDVDMGRESKRIFRQNEKTGTEMLERPMASSSGGSGSSGVWKTSNQSNDTIGHKRKSRDMEESECKSDGTELESASGNKSSQKSGTTRKSRVAEVHNMSERRRRDRINDKMKALQELIPNSNKSDKASVLDEAIEYMKSLQLQLQLMWMGRGMMPMMIPSMQQYMSRIGMGMSPPTLPQVQDLMRLSRFPLVNQTNITVPPIPNQPTIAQSAMLNYQNQIQNPCLPEQYANYMGFPSIQNSSQPINMFNFGSHSAQQSHVLAQPSNGNGYVL